MRGANMLFAVCGMPAGFGRRAVGVRGGAYRAGGETIVISEISAGLRKSGLSQYSTHTTGWSTPVNLKHSHAKLHATFAS